MKKLALTATIFCGIVFVLSGCHLGIKGSGLRKNEKRDVPEFTAINTSGMFEVEVKCQQPVSLEVEGDDNLLPLVQTEVVDGVLRIKTTRKYRSERGIIVRVTVPSLERIQASGAGKFRVSDVKNDRFEIHSSGVVELSATGQTKSLEIDESGAGKIDTHNLRAAVVDVHVSGAAIVDVFASDQLDVTVSGAANVTYSGDAKVSKHVSGAGSITKKELRGV